MTSIYRRNYVTRKPALLSEEEVEDTEHSTVPLINDNTDMLLRKRKPTLIRMLLERDYSRKSLQSLSRRDLVRTLCCCQCVTCAWVHPPQGNVWTRWHTEQIAALGPVYMMLPDFAPVHNETLKVYVHAQQLFYVLKQIEDSNVLQYVRTTPIDNFRSFMQRHTELQRIYADTMPNAVKDNPRRKTQSTGGRQKPYVARDRSSTLRQLRRASKVQLSQAIMSCPMHVRRVILNKLPD